MVWAQVSTDASKCSSGLGGPGVSGAALLIVLATGLASLRARWTGLPVTEKIILALPSAALSAFLILVAIGV